ncbi:MAG: gfo/Idh/MocA family oxidoreductase [Armatimonadetes bacterium]|nr:MAG: gfo/Idh/MocA family oxidoreductase [Armatimonadota bacterium]
MSKKEFAASRRQLLQAAGGVAAAAHLPKPLRAGVHVQGSDEIRVALVGCGGRGSGAAVNAVSVQRGPVKLVAMADVFEDRLNDSYKNLSGSITSRMDIPPERRFLGFDAYKRAMDTLRPGDVVILTTPPGFRWVHYEYAIQKKLNVFMEKPVSVDGPSSRKMLELNEKAISAGLKVGVGLMSRHTVGMQELAQRIREGAIGEIMLMRGYRMHGPAASSQSVPKPDGMSHLEYQIRRFHSFLWASGGCYSDFYIHHIDHLCWMKGALPVRAQGVGGRHYRVNPEGLPFVDQNFDSYAVEYTFGDGSKFFFEGRCMNGAHGIYSSYVHGTKGLGVVARAGDFGGPQAIHSNQILAPESLVWQSTDRSNPYQNEWEVLVGKIRDNEPHNEVKTGVETCLVTNMGRMAAHTGQEITFEQMLNCEHEFGPTVAELTSDSPSPLMPGADGRYPIPQPGILKDREY